jgi:putative nucleotidyltransferase with HDIG domain
MRPLPSTITRALNILDDNNATAPEVGELLGYDQALAANVLQAANSSYLGYGPSCSNLPDAVMRLGFSRIKTLVLGVAVMGNLNGSLPGYRLGAGELWGHARATAFAAQWIARTIFYSTPEDAYVAGLLHDIGKLLLDQFALADYERLFDLMGNYQLAFYQVEQRMFGIDHAQIGGMMAEKWKFPQTLVNAIQFHHSPDQSGIHRELGAIINLANAICPMDLAMMARMGKRSVHPDTLRVLKITPEVVKKFQEKILVDYREASEKNK